MTALGLELNATCARACAGSQGEFPCPVPLDPPSLELPLVISLERATAEVGSAGQNLVRRLPHLAFHGFLPFLGDPLPRVPWKAARRSLDSTEGLSLVFQKLSATLQPRCDIVLAVPSYLAPAQTDLALDLGRKAGLPIVGTVPVALAGSLAAYAEQNWFGTVVLLDCDDHGLTLATIGTEDARARLAETRLVLHLSLRRWKERLLNALADGCVRQSRRDPRDSSRAEQALYEQLDQVFDACQHQRMVQLGLQADHWFQNLVVQPQQAVSFCAGLVQQTLAEVEALWHSPWPDLPPSALLITSTAARLPGLLPALRSFFDEWTALGARNGVHKKATQLHEDFGEDLFKESSSGSATVVVLSEDAPSRAAHGLVSHFQRGELLSGHAASAPLPMPLPVEAGPARLHYQGQDYLLTDPTFTLGRQPGCDIVFDSDVFHSVAARHCEIIYDHRTYMLLDRSREGTLVNDCPVAGSVVLRSGDWIRLGPDGPALRFLGRSSLTGSALMTTA